MPPVKFLLGQEEMTHTENSPLTNKYQETLTPNNSELLAVSHDALHVSNITLCAMEFSGEGAMEQHICLLPLVIVSGTD